MRHVARAASGAEANESDHRFRVYAESASDAIFAIDEQSTILYVNEAAERIFGHSREAMTGQPLEMLIPDRHRAAHRAGMQRYITTSRRNIPWTGVELPGLRADGTEVPLEISFGEYSREGRRFFTGVARDVSERHEHSRSLELLAAELERKNKELLARSEEAESANRAKTDFLAVMSHELRTPLSAIMGYTELLQMGIPEGLPDPALEHVRRIDQAARHQLTLIEDILSFARIEQGHERARAVQTDLTDLLSEIVEYMQPVAGSRQLQLTLDAPPEPVLLCTEPAKLRQIVTNLLSNAIKFTPAGTIAVRLRSTPDEVHVDVSDTGMGIAEENHQRVFDPFWQVEQGTTREAGGMGLGLTLAQRMAELLGGDISVASGGLGKGSTFTLTLPHELASSDRQAASTPIRQAPEGTGM